MGVIVALEATGKADRNSRTLASSSRGSRRGHKSAGAGSGGSIPRSSSGQRRYWPKNTVSRANLENVIEKIVESD